MPLPDSVMRAIMGEQSAEEKRAALAQSHENWKAERYKEPPVQGTTRGDFANLGMLQVRCRLRALPVGRPAVGFALRYS